MYVQENFLVLMCGRLNSLPTCRGKGGKLHFLNTIECQLLNIHQKLISTWENLLAVSNQTGKKMKSPHFSTSAQCLQILQLARPVSMWTLFSLFVGREMTE